MPEVLATVSASLPRRVFGLGVLLLLGGMVLYIGLARHHEVLGWQLFLMVFGVAVLWLAERMRRATALRVDLTRTGLFDSAGRELVRIEDIAGIERGTFAIKPSHGFVVRLKAAGPRAWAPGLWWRLGRRVGIGGVTPASQTKFMAEMLAGLLAERERDVSSSCK
ncbi:MAG: hypothetical protein WCD16_14855 [Paracoccaceae bacterium]